MSLTVQCKSILKHIIKMSKIFNIVTQIFFPSTSMVTVSMDWYSFTYIEWRDNFHTLNHPEPCGEAILTHRSVRNVLNNVGGGETIFTHKNIITVSSEQKAVTCKVDLILINIF